MVLLSVQGHKQIIAIDEDFKVLTENEISEEYRENLSNINNSPNILVAICQSEDKLN